MIWKGTPMVSALPGALIFSRPCNLPDRESELPGLRPRRSIRAAPVQGEGLRTPESGSSKLAWLAGLIKGRHGGVGLERVEVRATRLLGPVDQLRDAGPRRALFTDDSGSSTARFSRRWSSESVPGIGSTTGERPSSQASLEAFPPSPRNGK